MQKCLNKTEKQQPVAALHTPWKINCGGIQVYVIPALQLTYAGVTHDLKE